MQIANPSIAHCRDEQLRCAAYIGTGHPEEHLALLGMGDWFAEEFLILAEGKEAAIDLR